MFRGAGGGFGGCKIVHGVSINSMTTLTHSVHVMRGELVGFDVQLGDC